MKAPPLTERKLLRFCGKKEARDWLNNPIVLKHGDQHYRYYSDAHALVRVPCDPEPLTEDSTAQRLGSYAIDEWKMSNLQPWGRELHHPIIPFCCENPKCKVCGGTGNKDIRYNILIPGVYIGTAYHKKIVALPNVRFVRPDIAAVQLGNTRSSYVDIIHFAFDGGVGAVMPCQIGVSYKESLHDVYNLYKRHLPGVPLFVDQTMTNARGTFSIDVINLDNWLEQEGLSEEGMSTQDVITKHYGESAAAFIQSRI